MTARTPFRRSPFANRAMCLALLLCTALPSALLRAQADPAAVYGVSFKDVSVAEFAAGVGDITGTDFVIDPRVRGTLSVESPRPVTAEELYGLLQDTMQNHGYATVRLPDDRVRIVPEQVARTQPLPVGLDDAQGNEIATDVLHTENLEASELAGILEPLIDANVGTLTPNPGSHSVVVTDWRANLGRLKRLTERLDGYRQADTEVFPVIHANAKHLVQTLNDALGEDGSSATVVADARANAVVAFGTQAQRRQVSTLIERLDAPQDHDTTTAVIPLSHADAADVAKVLGNLANSATGSRASPTRSASEGADSAEGQASAQTLPATSSGNGLDGVAFAVHPSSNALVLSGPPSALGGYRELVSRLDTRRAQVAVEAIIAEITESRAKELGVQWLFGDISGEGTVPAGGVNFSSSSSPGINQIAAAAASQDTSALGSLLGNLNGITTGVGQLSSGGVSFAMLLNALRSDTQTNLLSTPSLTTLDNEEASILVGQEVPFVTGSTTVDNSNPFQTIQREDVGVKLNIRPTIGADGSIRLEIVQEVSSIDEGVEASDVVTNKREIETTVLTQNGGIIVLGGLISDENANAEQKVPLLGDIPGVGRLFRYDRDTQDKRNLMVFIRARVLRDAPQTQQMARQRYTRMRQHMLKADVPSDRALPELPSAPTSPTASVSEASASGNGLQALYPSARSRLGSLAQ
ncbi:type II secretion system secretin GspD [Halomonas elongata]|uniref:type II secretion system secretin GspD n=1 Tax=Halomonas elongata TaxID=2746 RepID=UPI0023B0B456|nr:type II secretion system secretin GspD [Halomonas elongata]